MSNTRDKNRRDTWWYSPLSREWQIRTEYVDQLCKECSKVIEDEEITGTLCKKCHDEEVTMEMRAGVEESNWRNDHGDFN